MQQEYDATLLFGHDYDQILAWAARGDRLIPVKKARAEAWAFLTGIGAGNARVFVRFLREMFGKKR